MAMPTVITNKEAHMIYGNMNKEAGSSQATGYWSCQEKKVQNFRLFIQNWTALFWRLV